MTQNKKDVRIGFGYNLDRSSIAAAVQANKDVAASLALGTQAALAQKVASVQLGAQSVQSARQALDANNQLVASYRASTQAASEAARSASLLASARSAAGQAGGLLSTIPGLGPAGSAVSSVIALTQSFGPLGIAAGLGVVALKAVTDAENARVEAAKKYAELQAGVGAETSAELQKQIDAQLAARAGLQEGRARLQEYSEQLDITHAQLRDGTLNFFTYHDAIMPLNAAIFDATAGLIGRKEGIGELVTTSGALGSAIEQSDAKIQAINATLAFLGVQLVSNSTKANDAAAALQKTTDALAHTNALSNAVAEGLKRGAEIQALIKTQTDHYFDALTLEGKIRDELTAGVEKMNTIRAERDAKLLDLQADNAEKRAEIEANAAERLQDIARDSADRIYTIMRDSGRELTAAQGRRDALAFYESKLRQTDALDDQRKADKKAIDETARAMAKQSDVQQRAFEKQALQLYNATVKQLNIERAHQAQLATDLTNAQHAQQDIARYGSGGLQVIHNEMWANLNALTRNWANTVGASVGAILGGGIGGAVGSVVNPGNVGHGGAGGGGSSAYPPLSDPYGNIIGAARRGGGAGFYGPTSYPINEARSSAVLDLSRLRGAMPSNSPRRGDMNVSIVVNGANMSTSQLKRVISDTVIGAARKAGFG